MKDINTTGNQVIEDMMVFIEPNCRACENVLRIVKGMYRNKQIKKLTLINRIDEPEVCKKYNILIYPAVYIDGELTFYGEFKIADALKYVKIFI